MAEAELLGGGLDIEGWSFIKNEVQGKINEMTDRQGFILANQFFKKKREMIYYFQKLVGVVVFAKVQGPPVL